MRTIQLGKVVDLAIERERKKAHSSQLNTLEAMKGLSAEEIYGKSHYKMNDEIVITLQMSLIGLVIGSE